MKAIGDERDERRLAPEENAARKRVVVETYARNEATLRRTARRFSLCEDDAEDALQRGMEILLRKAPSDDPRQLIKWTQTVVKHEALAIRREREQTLAGPAALEAEPDTEDWVALLPAPTDGPQEQTERREAIARSREALQTLKPQELRALTLLAEGYSYVEIGEITGFSQTKINRCLAEGRERFRKLIARSEGGERCREMQPLISAFCDGEAKGEALVELREHLRACPHCRATLRAYRAAPAAASALAPLLPLRRSLLERAHDSLAELFGRLGGEAGAQAATGGAGGIGAVGLAKVAIVCVGAAGGAAACVATGIVPSPSDAPAARDHAAQVASEPAAEPPAPEPEVEPAPEPDPAPAPEQREPEPEPEPRAPAESETVAEPAPASEADPIEAAPPPEPAPEPAPAPVSSSGAGSPAGEFGP
ncbi:MAG TPA: sigma-70 family RNA polymerase sigma factor [Solirubrobacterales bacterium]|nr:sigma-70 family RNA polymerase sigma factor [Solirubrobacterales bacterium]